MKKVKFVEVPEHLQKLSKGPNLRQKGIQHMSSMDIDFIK